jgi:uncharacterized membrane protein (Fun14 family)
MKSLPKDKRDRLILVGMAAVAVIVGLYYGVVSSQRRSLETLAKQKVEQEGKLNGAKGLLAACRSSKATFKNLQAS